jgi:hypothetical protein
MSPGARKGAPYIEVSAPAFVGRAFMARLRVWPAFGLSHVVPSEECVTREPTHLSVCGGGER